MKKSAPPRGWRTTVKKLFYPHQHNNHRPHALRHQALGMYAALVLTFNVGYNIFVAHNNQVLGFATAISQAQLINLTNQTRLANGVSALHESPLLDKSAMLKAQNMFQEDYWAHFSPSGKSPWYWFDQAGYQYSLAGENLARDFDTSQGVIDGWMNSPTHRANMLTPGYTDIGIAVLNGTLGGEQTTLVVQHFGTPVTPVAATPITTTTKQGSAPIIKSTPPPTPVTATQTIDQQNQTPSVEGAVGVPSSALADINHLPYQLLHPQSPSSWGLQQTVTVVFLAVLALLFLFDSTVLFKQGIKRQGSHSLLHAGALAILAMLIIYSSVGGVL